MKPVRIGMITPSSNIVLEPISARILSGLPNVTAHAARIRVTEISLDGAALSQFSPEAFYPCADLLADAHVGVMGWNGTSSSWMGFSADETLSAEINRRYGIPTTSAVLAINELLHRFRAQKIALVTPYVDAIQTRIIESYRYAGYECVAERHAGVSSNYAFAEITEQAIWADLETVAAAQPDAVVILCTNMRGATLAASFEERFGIPLIDSVSAFLWGALRAAGVDSSHIQGWGRLFGISRISQS